MIGSERRERSETSADGEWSRLLKKNVQNGALIFHQPSDMRGYDMCVIPLQPDKRAYSCQAVQDGGAPPQQPAGNK